MKSEPGVLLLRQRTAASKSSVFLILWDRRWSRSSAMSLLAALTPSTSQETTSNGTANAPFCLLTLCLNKKKKKKKKKMTQCLLLQMPALVLHFGGLRPCHDTLTRVTVLKAADTFLLALCYSPSSLCFASYHLQTSSACSLAQGACCRCLPSKFQWLFHLSIYLYLSIYLSI